jgi:hypothetical protein
MVSIIHRNPLRRPPIVGCEGNYGQRQLNHHLWSPAKVVDQARETKNE